MYDLTEEQLEAARLRAESFIKQASACGLVGEEKIASQPAKSSSSLARPLMVGAGAAMATMAVPAIIEAVQNARVRSDKEKNISKMKRVHRDMRNMSREDLDIAYDSLAQHAPDVLRDPLLGGQMLKQMAEYRVADINALATVGKMRESRTNIFAKSPYGQGITAPLARGVGESSGNLLD